MAKARGSTKPKNPKKEYLRVHVPSQSLELKSPKLVSETLLECIKTGDLDAFRDVLAAHLTSTNKMALAKKAGIARRTVYDILDPKKKFNPALSTISAVIRALSGNGGPK